MTRPIRVGDKVLAPGGITGEVLRLERRRWGTVAILFTGEFYTREFTLGSLILRDLETPRSNSAE